MVVVEAIERGGAVACYCVRLGRFEVRLNMLNIGLDAPNSGVFLAKGSFGQVMLMASNKPYVIKRVYFSLSLQNGPEGEVDPAAEQAWLRQQLEDVLV